jgi:hypothetical protein
VEALRAYLREHSRPDLTGCWNWTRSLFTHGYGCAVWDGKTQKAHRLAYLAFVGEIPTGTLVRHTCHNRACVNPAHLIPGTYRDNYRDAREAGRNTRGEVQGSAKLTEPEVILIRERYASGGVSYAELGRQFGVDTTNIAMIVVGKAWRHAPGPITPSRGRGFRTDLHR